MVNLSLENRRPSNSRPFGGPQKTSVSFKTPTTVDDSPRTLSGAEGAVIIIPPCQSPRGCDGGGGGGGGVVVFVFLTQGRRSEVHNWSSRSSRASRRLCRGKSKTIYQPLGSHTHTHTQKHVKAQAHLRHLSSFISSAAA